MTLCWKQVDIAKDWLTLIFENVPLWNYIIDVLLMCLSSQIVRRSHGRTSNAWTNLPVTFYFLFLIVMITCFYNFYKILSRMSSLYFSFYYITGPLIASLSGKPLIRVLFLMYSVQFLRIMVFFFISLSLTARYTVWYLLPFF